MNKMQVNNNYIAQIFRNRYIAFILAQTCICVALAQPTIKASLLKQKSMSSIGILHANYSGITKINADTFAIISDKPDAQKKIAKIIKIEQSPQSGKITNIQLISTLPENNNSNVTKKDCEDITYNPQTNTFFICDETDNEIWEYDRTLKQTGRKHAIPSIFNNDNIMPNKGFEALHYAHNEKTYWAITESNLRSDEDSTSRRKRLRLLSFNEQLKLVAQYIYETEEPIYLKQYKEYAFGVPAITALDDGSLLVMEREVRVKNSYIGSNTNTRIFNIRPKDVNRTESSKNIWDQGKSVPVSKTPVCSFSTYLKIGKFNFGNYEGMCLGRKLNDGRQTVILISDSQNGAGNALFRLKDYLKVIVIDKKEQYYPL